MTSNATLARDHHLTPVSYHATPLNFIQHPANIPLQLTPSLDEPPLQSPLPLGLICNTDQEFSAGSMIAIRCQQLAPEMYSQGQIVWCRRQPYGYQVAVAFFTQDELYRIRMLEQLCHIDHYRRSCRKDGTPLSRESAALEWIDKFAAHFPTDGL